MDHKIHEMNKSYSTQPSWALLAIFNGDRDQLIFSRGFCVTS